MIKIKEQSKLLSLQTTKSADGKSWQGYVKTDISKTSNKKHQADSSKKIRQKQAIV